MSAPLSDVQQLKNDIWRVKQKIIDIEKQRDEWQKQLDEVNQIIEYGAKDEVLDIKPEIESTIAELNDKLAPLYKQRDDMQAKLPAAPKPTAPKFDVEKHPVLKKMVEKPNADVPINFQTGDIVEAQWTDKQFYKAKIQTILGSKSAPKYHIKFIDYDENMTVDRENLRAIPVKRKRELEEPAAPVTSTPQVISGPVSVNPEAKKAKEAAAADAPMPRRRNIPNKKTLEKGVNSWKDWSSKGVGKKQAIRESMFRTGTNEGSRVGFTGSGAGMTAAQKRVRHNTKDDIAADMAAEEALKAAQSPRQPFEPRDTRQPLEPREPREFREPREPREPREFREPREHREHREPREPREPRHHRDRRDSRDSHDSRDSYEARHHRESADRPREPYRRPADTFVKRSRF